MRAYMSEVDGGPAFLRAPLYCDVTGRTHTHSGMASDNTFAAEWALTEVQRILADVEPCGVYDEAPYALLPHNERAALAEGIAGAIVALQDMIESRCLLCGESIAEGSSMYCFVHKYGEAS